MDYKNIVIDFVKRTKSNLDFIEQQNNTFGVTQLINSLLGIIVLPKEKNIKIIPNLSFDELLDDGWELPQITINQYKINKLRDLIRVLRNSVAHFNLEIRANENEEIIGIRFYNKNKRKKITFSAEYSLANLKKFIEKYILILSSS
jgi:hypothetical protein